MEKSGRIEMIIGPMFSGKSSELIRRVNRYMIAGYKVQAYKPRIDNRYGTDVIASHDNEKLKAVAVSHVGQIYSRLEKDTAVVAIDEVQFLDDGILFMADWLAASGRIFIASGLNLDFRGEPFPFMGSSRTMAELIVRADRVDMLSAICTYAENGLNCGCEATRTQRIVNGEPASYDSPLIMVGASEAYEARCRNHHFVPNAPVLHLR
ncbi:MAG TPA: thymidine kinase [Nanoarchaeota archaeon]|nr:thymidine kinase [Nanoarchaeota archaeon]